MAPSVVRHRGHKDFVSRGGFQESRIEVALEKGTRLDGVGGDALGRILARQDRPAPGGGQLAHGDLIAGGPVAGQAGPVGHELPTRHALGRRSVSGADIVQLRARHEPGGIKQLAGSQIVVDEGEVQVFARVQCGGR